MYNVYKGNGDFEQDYKKIYKGMKENNLINGYF